MAVMMIKMVIGKWLGERSFFRYDGYHHIDTYINNGRWHNIQIIVSTKSVDVRKKGGMNGGRVVSVRFEDPDLFKILEESLK